MRLIATILCLLQASVLFAQDNGIGIIEIEPSKLVVIQEEKIPCEDKLDENGAQYQNALAKGIEIFNYGISDCDDSYNPFELKPRISAIETSSDTITIHLQLTKNCCTGSLSTIEVIDSSKWNLIIKDQIDGCGECFCHCCFSAFFQVKNRSSINPQTFLLNGNPVDYIDANGNLVKQPK